MPAISRFLGIVVYMFMERGEPHRLPHFHAYFGEFTASFAINPPALLEGTLPRRQLHLVLAWAELHEDELRDNWQRLQNGQLPLQIQGL